MQKIASRCKAKEMGWLADGRTGLKIRRASVLGSSKPLRVPGIGSLPVEHAEETASFPLIDMQFTVCSQCLEKKYLVSDSCPAEAWCNSDFLEDDFWPACAKPRRREARFFLIGLLPGTP